MLCVLHVSVGSSALCGYSPRCPKTRRSSRDSPAGVMRDRANRAPLVKRLRSDARSRVRWYGHGPRQEPASAESASPACLAAVRLAGVERLFSAWVFSSYTPIDDLPQAYLSFVPQ